MNYNPKPPAEPVSILQDLYQSKANGACDGLERTVFLQVGSRPIRPDGVDKVTGRARFGADFTMPGMLVGKILRSPHAHARIVAIDTTRAEKLDGVKAIVTRDDFTIGVDRPRQGEPELTLRGQRLDDVIENVMARKKALYDGHAVAAVAATSVAVAQEALRLIEVVYEQLPHVTDVDEAMQPGAPIIHDDLFTKGLSSLPQKPSNIARCVRVAKGDVAVGFAGADEVVAFDFRTEAVHQGYIEPHACVARYGEDGRAELWCCTQGHFYVRNVCARVLGISIAKLRVIASEIGGGFGGKTTVFIEPVALMLARKARRPVKVVMSRDEVFRATGPTSSTSQTIKIGATRDGRITAAQLTAKYQGGAFPGSHVEEGILSAFACYRVRNLELTGYDVVVNRPKCEVYRAPGAPMANFAVESTIDELARRLNIDPIDFRMRNAVVDGDESAYGVKFGPIGLMATLEATKSHPHWQATPEPGAGRGVACGFWFNWGGHTSVSLNLSEDGSVNLVIGTPDIGGSRAAMCLMAAEALGISYDKVTAVVADTDSLAYNEPTEGSRTAFATGMATIKAANEVIVKLRQRAARLWQIPVESVGWQDGSAVAIGSHAALHTPMTLAEIASGWAGTGGPISGHAETNVENAGVSFGTHIADVAVDWETGRSTVLRYTVIQDAGKAVHPSYVEGQMQGGAVQGIGWALNEEYMYSANGRLQNPGFLDYRIPVASDLPMIGTRIVEVANPSHPYGVRGVGENPIVPPLAAIANAVRDATGVRMKQLPMSPPRVLHALSDSKPSTSGSGAGSGTSQSARLTSGS